MKEILAAAEELGRMIRETETGRRYLRASELLNSDPDARAMIDEFTALSEQLKRRREMGDSIEGFETARNEELAAALSNNEKVMEFLAAQKDYVELLVMIQGEIEGV